MPELFLLTEIKQTTMNITRKIAGIIAESLMVSAAPVYFTAWVIRAYESYPFFPRNNLIHDVQEFFPLRFPLSQAILIIAECHLAHFSFSPAFSSFFYYTILFAA